MMCTHKHLAAGSVQTVCCSATRPGELIVQRIYTVWTVLMK
ncbi:hypothetical protein X907_0160 [Glycocaulis alkaliphilus]|uniref:Uncharacterized protein n=1 Tax=Glycocaulis alkaliphilus TaxID=1434191 RepID=A0A3T0E606_9PROT|nr:hypothetical protein X907_0160 [Glycocaulis alkaliphilus]